MTREEAKRRAELYSALAKGKSVQVQGIDGMFISDFCSQHLTRSECFKEIK